MSFVEGEIKRVMTQGELMRKRYAGECSGVISEASTDHQRNCATIKPVEDIKTIIFNPPFERGQNG